jgi:hypothetical protein
MLTLCVLGLMIVFSAAQTPSELRQKYGLPDKNGQYTIRPNVVTSVVCQSDNQGCRILIKPKRSDLLIEGDTQGVSPQVVAEVIEEFSPANQRGAFINSISYDPSPAVRVLALQWVSQSHWELASPVVREAAETDPEPKVREEAKGILRSHLNAR